MDNSFGKLLVVRFFLASFVCVTVFVWTCPAEAANCSDCHQAKTTGKVVHAAVSMGCGVCHDGAHDMEKFAFSNGKPKGLSSEVPQLCMGCHDESEFGKKTIHPALSSGCTACHNPHASENDHLLLAVEPDICFGCHEKERFMEGKSVHPAIGFGCTVCHNPHSTDGATLLKSDPPGLCFNCHKAFDRKVKHSPISMCSNCHDPHASKAAEKLLKLSVDKLCVDCHGVKKFKKRYVHGPVSLGLCTSCHFPHDSENEKLLQASGAELCFMCHEKSGFEMKNVHPPVKDGNCTACHDPHTARGRFQLDGPINSVCFGCHPGKGKEPHVLRGFGGKEHPMKGVPDPKRAGRGLSCSSCHNPHSSESIRLFRYDAEKVFDVCKNCHKDK